MCYCYCYSVVRSGNDGNLCAVNPLFVAIVVDYAFVVIPISQTGRIDFQCNKVIGHSGQILDLKWNPFNDCIIASASDDCTVRLIWFILNWISSFELFQPIYIYFFLLFDIRSKFGAFLKMVWQRTWTYLSQSCWVTDERFCRLNGIRLPTMFYSVLDSITLYELRHSIFLCMNENVTLIAIYITGARLGCVHSRNFQYHYTRWHDLFAGYQSWWILYCDHIQR